MSAAALPLPRTTGAHAGALPSQLLRDFQEHRAQKPIAGIPRWLSFMLPVLVAGFLFCSVMGFVLAEKPAPTSDQALIGALRSVKSSLDMLRAEQALHRAEPSPALETLMVSLTPGVARASETRTRFRRNVLQTPPPPVHYRGFPGETDSSGNVIVQDTPNFYIYSLLIPWLTFVAMLSLVLGRWLMSHPPRLFTRLMNDYQSLFSSRKIAHTAEGSISARHVSSHVKRGKKMLSNDWLPSILAVESLYAIEESQDTLIPLLKMAMPALMSIFLLPPMILAELFADLNFWPDGYPTGIYSINDALVVYITPAGLVYSLIFGFSFATATDKFNKILLLLWREINYLYHMALILYKMPATTSFFMRRKIAALKIIQDHALSLSRQLSMRSQDSMLSSIEFDDKLWEIFDYMREGEDLRSAALSEQAAANPSMLPVITAQALLNSTSLSQRWGNKLCDIIMEIGHVISERSALSSAKITGLQWFFMLVLGYIVVWLVIYVQTYSFTLGVTMSIATAISISFLAFIVADLDEPFHGFFKIKLFTLARLINSVAAMVEVMELEASELEIGERWQAKAHAQRVAREKSARDGGGSSSLRSDGVELEDPPPASAVKYHDALDEYCVQNLMERRGSSVAPPMSPIGEGTTSAETEVVAEAGDDQTVATPSDGPATVTALSQMVRQRTLSRGPSGLFTGGDAVTAEMARIQRKLAAAHM